MSLLQLGQRIDLFSEFVIRNLYKETEIFLWKAIISLCCCKEIYSGFYFGGGLFSLRGLTMLISI